jgi:hypothetical protein
MTPAAVILLVLGIIWFVTAAPFPNNQWGNYSGFAGFLFCVVLALHVFHALGL